jgi:hypothetical protein
VEAVGVSVRKFRIPKIFFPLPRVYDIIGLRRIVMMCFAVDGVTVWTVTVIVVVYSAVDGVTVWTVAVIVIVRSAVDGVTVWTVTTVVMRMLCEYMWSVNAYIE